jgi:hypothetical protein
MRFPIQSFNLALALHYTTPCNVTLCEMEIPCRETGLGDVVERHGVVGVDGEHRVDAGLAGVVHRRGEVREQCRVEQVHQGYPAGRGD